MIASSSSWGPFGRVDLAHVTGFEVSQVTQSVRVDRLDGVQLGAELPRGWQGSFLLDRGTLGGRRFHGADRAGLSVGAGDSAGNALSICE
ncbi:unnamed protein product [Acidocella sp. C78]|nr:unnamed protein product [Acidocella sp. C78]